MSYLKFFHVSIGLAAMAGLLSFSCGANLADQCDYQGKCAGGAGGSSGAAGHAGTKNGGEANGGSSGGATEGGSGNEMGGNGGAGTNGAAAGEGGGPVVPIPCGGMCPSETPVCKEVSDTCVECLLPKDCKALTKPKCGPESTCVECLTPSDCQDSAKTKCDAANTCVQCLSSTDCASPTAARCDGGSCAKCTSNDDCAHIAGKTVCDVAAGECVQCTGKDYAACGKDMGTARVCDSLKRTCTTSKEKSAELCNSCVSDAQCNAGQLCVKETFGTPAKDVGYFCFWKKGDTANGAPTACLSEPARPYAATVTAQTSIDGVSAELCGLASSTCIAQSQFRLQNCGTVAPDDQKCGFAPGKDSKCVQADVGVYLCTVTCLSDFDCPGVTCKSGPAPRVCNF